MTFILHIHKYIFGGGGVMSSPETIISGFSFAYTPPSFSMIVLGPPGAGKTTFMMNAAYQLKSRIPTGRVICESITSFNSYSEIFGPKYCTDTFDENHLKLFIRRQKEMAGKCKAKNGDAYIGNRCLLVIDDVTSNVKNLKCTSVQYLFKNLSQHGSQAMFLGLHYFKEIPPALRSSTTYIAVGFDPSNENRKKMYDAFGSLFRTFDNFCDALDLFTADHGFLIFKTNSSSFNLEDRVAYFKPTPNLPVGWRFGCREYQNNAGSEGDEGDDGDEL